MRICFSLLVRRIEVDLYEHSKLLVEVCVVEYTACLLQSWIDPQQSFWHNQNLDVRLIVKQVSRRHSNRPSIPGYICVHLLVLLQFNSIQLINSLVIFFNSYIVVLLLFQDEKSWIVSSVLLFLDSLTCYFYYYYFFFIISFFYVLKPSGFWSCNVDLLQSGF